MTWLSMVLILLLDFFFALSFITAKEAVGYGPPVLFVAIRMSLAAFCFFLYFLFYDKKKLSLSRDSIIGVALFGLLNIYLNNALEYWALQYISAARTCFIYSFTPFISALLAHFFFQEKLGWRSWLYLILGFCGLYAVLCDHTPDEVYTGMLGSFSWAEMAVLGAATAGALGWLFMQRVLKKTTSHFATINAYGMLLGGGVGWGHSYLMENWSNIDTSSLYHFLMWIALTVVISNFVAANIYGYLLKSLSATFVAFANFITVFFAIFLEVIFYGHWPTQLFWVGVIITTASIYLFGREEMANKNIN